MSADAQFENALSLLIQASRVAPPLRAALAVVEDRIRAYESALINNAPEDVLYGLELLP